MAAKPIAAMGLGVPAAPAGAHQPTDTIASSLLRDSAASGRRGIFGRGRDGSYLPPPAQIRTCGTTAYGSCLGYMTRSAPQGKDVHFWV